MAATTINIFTPGTSSGAGGERHSPPSLLSELRGLKEKLGELLDALGGEKKSSGRTGDDGDSKLSPDTMRRAADLLDRLADALSGRGESGGEGLKDEALLMIALLMAALEGGEIGDQAGDGSNAAGGDTTVNIFPGVGGDSGSALGSGSGPGAPSGGIGDGGTTVNIFGGGPAGQQGGIGGDAGASLGGQADTTINIFGGGVAGQPGGIGEDGGAESPDSADTTVNVFVVGGSTASAAASSAMI